MYTDFINSVTEGIRKRTKLNQEEQTMKKKHVLRLLAAAVTMGMLAGTVSCGNAGQNDSQESSQAEKEKTEESEQESGDGEESDMVFCGGTILTMLSEDDMDNSAVAVKDGEIVYVGDEEGIEKYISDETEVIDLDGQTLMPGFIDGHIHEPGNFLTENTTLILPEGNPDLNVYKKAIQEFIDDNPDFPIYQVASMDLQAFPNNIPENSWMEELDTDKPVVLSDTSKHGRLANKIAIEMAGITKDSTPPDGGKVFLDENGELTGYFSDAASMLDSLPTIEYTKEQIKEAYDMFQKLANSYGLTAIDSGGADDNYAVVSDMEKDGELTLRINTTSWAGQPLGTEEAERLIKLLDDYQKYASDFMRVCQVKFSLDGVPEGATSALLEPYTKEAGQEEGYAGTQKATEEDLTLFVTAMNAAGYSVETHAMGDASVQRSMNAFEAAAETNGGTPDGVINKIAHVNLLTTEDMTRMADEGVIAAMQPLWFYYDPFFSAQEESNLGKERFEQEYHIRDMIDEGVIITGSNDYPVTADFAPLHAIEAGATQQSPYEGEDDDPAYIRNPEQSATVYEMLQMYTVNAAYGAHMDDIVGTVEEGKKADFVILGDNPLTCDVKAISDITVEYTISDGRIVYQK